MPDSIITRDSLSPRERYWRDAAIDSSLSRLEEAVREFKTATVGGDRELTEPEEWRLWHIRRQLHDLAQQGARYSKSPLDRWLEKRIVE